MRTASLCGTLAVAVLSGFGFAGSAAAAAPLYWRSIPAPGATVTLDAGTGPGLVVSAASPNPHQHVTLSLLGSSPARLHAKAGNPAVGVLRVPGSTRAIRPFAVTVVARIAGARVTITRTVIISIRGNRVSL
ncbi:MAG: hypothetical protein ACRDL2_03760, partial [Gaiellaceae bacterium]